MIPTDSVQWKLLVDKHDISYLVSIFEAYDHLAVVRTLDQSRGLVELMVAPDFLDDTRRLVQALKQEIPIQEFPVETGPGRDED